MASRPDLSQESQKQQSWKTTSNQPLVDSPGMTQSSQESVVQDLGSGVKASGLSSSDDEVDFDTSTGTLAIFPEYPSPTPTMLIHLTPEADRTFEKLAQKDSPSPTSSRIRDLTSSGERKLLTQLKRSSLYGSSVTPDLTPDSSFDLISSPSDHEEYASPTRRTSFAPFTSYSSPASPIKERLVDSGFSEKLHPGSSIQPSSSRSRAYSGPMSRHPSTRPSSNTSSLLPGGAEKDFLGSYDLTRRRASHDGQFLRNRASLSGIALSPIPDATDDAIEVVDTLNPTVKAFNPLLNSPATALPTLFGEVIQGGKTALGDLTKEARLALSQLGLKPIPSMHGPLSLPYARCPSGIDAFLFSPERDDDPYTFILEPDGRRPPRHSGHRVNPVPLPGNARYSLATHLRTSNRSVSAPSGASANKENMSKEINRRLRIFSSPAEMRSRGVRDVPAQERFEHNENQHDDIADREAKNHLYQQRREMEEDARHAYDNLNYSEVGHDSDSFAGPPTLVASPGYPSAYPYPYYSYPWPGYGPHYYPAYPPPQPFYPPHAYPRMSSSVPISHQDPAIVSYVYRNNNAEADESTETSYHTANEEDSPVDSEDEEPQLAGFFFPAVPSQSRGQYRRDSLSSATTTVPRYFNRKPSMAMGGPLASLLAERRNSSAPNLPHVQRRKSVAPLVTVSASRRSSAVGQPQVFEARAVRQPRNPPSISSSPIVSQPVVAKAPAHNLIPHRSRPQIATDVEPAKAALHSPARTIQSPLSRTALSGISNDNILEHASARTHRRGSSTGIKQSIEHPGKGGEANWRAHGATKLSVVGDPSIDKKVNDPQEAVTDIPAAVGDPVPRHYGRYKSRARKGKAVKTDV